MSGDLTGSQVSWWQLCAWCGALAQGPAKSWKDSCDSWAGWLFLSWDRYVLDVAVAKKAAGKWGCPSPCLAPGPVPVLSGDCNCQTWWKWAGDGAGKCILLPEHNELLCKVVSAVWCN